MEFQSWTLRQMYPLSSWWGPRLNRREIESLYYEVYKLQRLPGSPPGEPELMAEVVSSLEDCQGQE